MLKLLPNGPAIKFSRCYLTQYRAGSSFFRQDVVTVQGRYGAFFAVRVQFAGLIRVSRYKFLGEQVVSQDTLIFIESSGAVWVYLV